ncbi:[protein-PII] uridylyltransferase [Paraferrimonas sedimenticola]|uniref:Bifunctional uridylyltransferase/uridylyl-removing enzyme n=1 Tax=Paraferrimonas sedimenticola TaxID=375674 RepID=A0AA37W0Y2_9GAMM|nr:[protein-PII] uridylyltransferase [Paraferrimonas sedimenticola]GLP96283.1 bifunctional uridylyltransferase/uridylyl-removing enzyme [Paraferrimonas sedimenticola]
MIAAHPKASGADLRQALKEFGKRQTQDFFSSSIAELERERAAYLDTVLVSLWEQFGLCQSSLSLNAVGGYGRQRLHPQSDLDICVLHQSPLTDEQQQQLSRFLAALWDLGVEIGHSIRAVDDCLAQAASDVTIATNLLEIRTICGNQQYSAEVLRALNQESVWTKQGFFKAKLTEQTKRHEKIKQTALYLEPNLKTQPGGLRDFHTANWLAQKYSAQVQPEKPAKIFLTSDEYNEFSECYDYLSRIRWALHCVANRAGDVLRFEYQAQVASFMGFGEKDTQLAIESMMRQLFRAMTRIRELNKIILDRLSEEVFPSTQERQWLDEVFYLQNRVLHSATDTAFIKKSNVLKLFHHLLQHPNITDICPHTLRRLRQNRRRLLGELKDYQDCRKLLIQILDHPNCHKSAIGWMHRYGVLASYWSDWRSIEGKMQFDMHNAYTTDEHAVQAVKQIKSIWASASKSETYQICAQVQHKTALTTALLFHHVGGELCSQSAQRSGEKMAEFAQLHDFTAYETELIEWLIVNQHAMTTAIQTLNLDDVRAAIPLAKKISSRMRLNALFAFTVADMKATNDQHWNDWHESQLHKLYQALLDNIVGGIETETKLEDSMQASYAEIKMKGERFNRLPNSLVSILDNRLNLEESQEQLIRTFNSGEQISIFQMDSENCTGLIIYTQDMPYLFLNVFNLIRSAKFNVKEVEIFSTDDGKVIEIIKLLDENHKPILDDLRLEKLQSKITQLIAEGEINVALNNPRHLRNFDEPAEVEIVEKLSDDTFLIRIKALDDPNHMESICKAFDSMNLRIHSAKITALGESCDNVFLVSPRTDEQSHADSDSVIKAVERQLA